ncbi:hypothetical protein PM082_005799 [Marasmius tenuissimus]|nr:hypothetical protein PM082_005799 [Marasmius tenuissimus]
MFLIYGLLLSLSLYVNAALRTVIVDDASGDQLSGAQIAFLPSNNGFSQGPLCRGCSDSWCQGCALEPDPSKAYGGTWRVANHFQGNETTRYLQFDFVGIAVAIYCIVPNLPSSSGLVTQYAIDFRIDDQLPPNGKTTYNHVSDASGTYAYNVPVLNQTGLRNERHTIIVRIMPVPDVDVVLLFDYATYTFDDENSELQSTPFSSSANSSSRSMTSSSSTPIGSTSSMIPSTNSTSTVPPTSTPTPRQDDNPPVTGNQRKHLAVILGSSIGSFVVLSVLGVLLICCLRRRRDFTGPQTSQIIRPFTPIIINPRRGLKSELSTDSAENLSESGSSAHPQESTHGEGVDSVDSGSEDPPPEYSSHPDVPP